MAGGITDAIDSGQELVQETAPQALEFGSRLLVWLEDPMHWFPAILIIVGLGVWRGSIKFERGRRSDASLIKLIDSREGRQPKIPPEE